MRWWWLSFCDANGRFVGGAIVKASDGPSAMRIAPRPLGAAECQGGEMPEANGDPPDGYVGRVFDRDDAYRLAELWGARIATSEETEAMFLKGPELS